MSDRYAAERRVLVFAGKTGAKVAYVLARFYLFGADVLSYFAVCVLPVARYPRRCESSVDARRCACNEVLQAQDRLSPLRA
jgi:hypothetical protein